MSSEILTSKNIKEKVTSIGIKEVLIPGNRGPCGGVNMAIEVTTQVLDIVSGREPVYTNWPIVNNKLIMQEFGERGLIDVNNDWNRVPQGSIVLFSAHGVPPAFRQIAKKNNYLVIDATCQLVNRVHNLVKKAEQDGKFIVYVGTKGHPETNGVIGEVNPKNIAMVQTMKDIDELSLPTGKEVVVYSQTTLSTSEIKNQLAAIQAKSPEKVNVPPRWDICYAVDNRQTATRKMVEEEDIQTLLIVGSKHSHNSQMMRKIGESKGVPSYSVDTPGEINAEDWFVKKKVTRVGVSSGASVLERYLQPVLEWFSSRGASLKYLPQVKEEKEMTFTLPQKDLSRLKQRFGIVN